MKMLLEVFVADCFAVFLSPRHTSVELEASVDEDFEES